MNFLVPLMLFGWVPFTIYLFNKKPAHKAVIVSTLGGVMFLPPFVPIPYRFFGLNSVLYDKNAAIVIGILIAGLFFSKTDKNKVKLGWFDFPLILWCTLCPVLTSLSNNLGIVNGVSNMFKNFFEISAFYLLGRIYLYREGHIKDLCKAIMIGGTVYALLCIYEVRMGPFLNQNIYGYFASSYFQHIRGGGYRPLVFMNHGLMTTLWVGESLLITFWLWREKKIRKLGPFPIGLITFGLLGTMFISRSSGSLSLTLIGFLLYFFYRKRHKTWPLKLMIIIVPIYLYFRMSNVISTDDILERLSIIFDSERLESLWVRLYQEDLYNIRVRQRFLLGWDGFGRSVPIDPRYGTSLRIIDSLWLVIYSRFGLLGLICGFFGILAGPFTTLFNAKKTNHNVYAVALSLTVIIFILDSLLNGMINPIYILTSGALVSYQIRDSKLPRAAQVQIKT